MLRNSSSVRPVSIYRSRSFKRQELLIMLLLASPVVLLPAGIGTWRFMILYVSLGFREAFALSWYWLAVGAGFFLITILLIALRGVRSSRFVAVYPNGLRLRLDWQKPLSLSWSDLAGFSSQIIQERFLHHILHTDQHVILFLKNGDKLTLRRGFQGMPEFIQQIQDHLYPRLKPGLQSRWQKGKWIWFGPLGVSLAGVQIRNEVSPILWEQVEEVGIDSGSLCLRIKGHPLRKIPCRRVPNLTLLFELLEQRSKG